MSDPTNQTSSAAAPTEGTGSSVPPEASATGAPAAGDTQQSTQSGAGDAGAQDSGDKSTEAAKPAGAPEKYEFKPPEGVDFDPEGLKAYEEFAKSQNMSQDAAQGLLEKLAPAMQARQKQLVESTLNSWVEAAKADKEIGGDKFDESVSLADKALKQFGTAELDALLQKTGFAKNPEILRAFARIGKAISEDSKFVTGGDKGDGAATLAQRMYPGMNP